MSNLQAEVRISFGDREHLFSLKCRELENLEIACKASVSEIAYRVIGLRPTIGDIKNIIILGLEGGGMPSVQAAEMFRRYADGKPLFVKDDPSSPAIVAARVMEAAWFGVDQIVDAEDPAPAGKGKAGDPMVG